MPTITYIQPDGTERVVNVKVGSTVMEGARSNGVDGIVAECGGACSCATCHVYVEGGWATLLPEMTSTENAMLEFAEDRRPTSRLSCQLVVSDALDGMTVTVAEEQ